MSEYSKLMWLKDGREVTVQSAAEEKAKLADGARLTVDAPPEPTKTEAKPKTEPEPEPKPDYEPTWPDTEPEPAKGKAKK